MSVTCCLSQFSTYATLLRFADLECSVLAIKVLQTYRLEYHHHPVGLQTGFVNKPDRKIRMKLIRRP